MNALDGRTVRASRKRENRRKRILEHAKSVFAERGYHQTHVSDIIKAAGIARGTFYLYFESKNAIFAELLEDLLGEMRSSIHGVDTGENAPPVEMQLIGIVRKILTTVAENRALARILVREAVGLDSDIDARLAQFYSDLLAYIQDSLDRGKTMGLLRNFDTQVGAFCILGTIKQLMEQLIMDENGDLHQDVDRIALAVLDFNLRGVLKT